MAKSVKFHQFQFFLTNFILWEYTERDNQMTMKDETFALGLINGFGRLQLELLAAEHKMPVYRKPLVF